MKEIKNSCYQRVTRKYAVYDKKTAKHLVVPKLFTIFAVVSEGNVPPYVQFLMHSLPETEKDYDYKPTTRQALHGALRQ